MLVDIYSNWLAVDKQNYAACSVRTVGHDLMDFRFTSDGIATGGSDGCMNFEDEDNMGIIACLEKICAATTYSEWCGSVSLVAFFVFAAEVVMARTATFTTQTRNSQTNPSSMHS